MFGRAKKRWGRCSVFGDIFGLVSTTHAGRPLVGFCYDILEHIFVVLDLLCLHYSPTSPTLLRE